jgi:hypothetical protein
VVGAQDDFWGCRRLALLRLVAKASHVGGGGDAESLQVVFLGGCGARRGLTPCLGVAPPLLGC